MIENEDVVIYIYIYIRKLMTLEITKEEKICCFINFLFYSSIYIYIYIYICVCVCVCVCDNCCRKFEMAITSNFVTNL